MTGTGWIFSGQGAQATGMGQAFFNRKSFAATIEAIEVASGQPVRDMLTRFSDADLRRTDRAQLAIFAMSMGIVACLHEGGLTPAVATGHSLGYFSALAAIGVLTLADAAQLVAFRGKLMVDGNERCPGGMGVVRGLDAETIAALLSGTNLRVWVANLNLPNQTVVSGARADLAAAGTALIAAGGIWLPLNVSGAFHSPLLGNEERLFADHLDAINFRDPVCPVISNKAELLNKADTIRRDLRDHMTSQVLWLATMRQLADLGLDGLIEVGPGKVLTGLVLRFKPDMKPISTATRALLDRAIGSCLDQKANTV